MPGMCAACPQGRGSNVSFGQGTHRYQIIETLGHHSLVVAEIGPSLVLVTAALVALDIHLHDALTVAAAPKPRRLWTIVNASQSYVGHITVAGTGRRT